VSTKTSTNTIYPKTEKGHLASVDQAQLRDRILKESTTTRAQLWYFLCALQLGREEAKQQQRQDWIEQINEWIDRLGAMYNSLLYLQANVYEFGLNTKFLRLRDLQNEMKHIKAIRTDRLVIKCFQQMPDALNVPVNTIEEEMAMFAAENEARKSAKFEEPDPWAA
jgi:hypothetical protein